MSEASSGLFSYFWAKFKDISTADEIGLLVSVASAGLTRNATFGLRQC